MSTPEERIRTAVELAQRSKAAADAKMQAEETAREQMVKMLWQRAETLAQKSRTRARELVDAGRVRVHLLLERRRDRENTDPGFLLAIGRPAKGTRGIRAVPQVDGQCKVIVFNGGTQSRLFPDDTSFEQNIDEVLEPLVTEAAVALAKGEEPPGDIR